MNKLKKENNILFEGNLTIIGSRNFNNYSYAKRKIIEIINKNKISITKIISGGASGADKIAEIFASKFNIPLEIIFPDWSKGKYAGILRNTEIVNKSDYIIAFWDGKSKGTLDSINKAKKNNKKLFIIKVNSNSINEGVSLKDDEFIFDFRNDSKNDILTLKYNKNYIISRLRNNIQYYFSYKLNKKIDKKDRFRLLTSIKNKLIKNDDYEKFISKAIIGLFNNPYFELSDIDIIIFPSSTGSLNLDIANKIKSKIPNALFIKDLILKNDVENITLNYELLKQKKFKSETILAIEKIVESSIREGIFNLKKVPPKFREFIYNFLKINIKNRQILNKLNNGKILVIDDFISKGTTFNEVNNLIKNYMPKDIIFYSLIE